MREIVLDTETTGLDPATGDRIVEIGAVELMNGVATGAVYHVYLNPQRDVPEDAVRVHGLTGEFLADKPLFAAVADEFCAFIGDDRLVIHNAEFDMKFINAELGKLGRPALSMTRVLDTLALARRKHPGAPASLDALCARYGIDASRRKKHGALLDSELLAEVYLELNGGRQSSFALQNEKAAGPAELKGDFLTARPAALAPRLSPAEREAHAAFIAGIGEKAFWRKYQGA
jgi:DNA polymerase-3 subunit epsilon